MFNKANVHGYRELVAGVEFKTTVFGDRTLMGEFRAVRGASVPLHSHHHEQTGYLVSGRMKFVIGEDRFEVGAGDSWCIPGNVEHSADFLEDSVVIEVFSPVREEYLPKHS